MPYVDDATDTLTEVFWQNSPETTRPIQAVPPASTSKLSRFFGSLVASMRLHGRTCRMTCGQQPILTPTDILAQNYPHLYIQITCG
jgi:hypothetical protein